MSSSLSDISLMDDFLESVVYLDEVPDWHDMKEDDSEEKSATLREILADTDSFLVDKALSWESSKHPRKQGKFAAKDQAHDDLPLPDGENFLMYNQHTRPGDNGPFEKTADAAARLKDGRVIPVHLYHKPHSMKEYDEVSVTAPGGQVSFYRQDDGNYVAHMVRVDPSQQHQGVASAMYDLAEAAGYKIRPAQKGDFVGAESHMGQTPEGSGFWAARRKRQVAKAAHDVEQEKRDEGGKWTAGGAAAATAKQSADQAPAKKDAEPAAPSEDLDAKAKKVEERVRQLLTDGKDTLSLYDKVAGAVGMYTPERQKQHDAIIDSIMQAHAKVPSDRRAVISGGLTGAGKTSTLKSEVGKSTANINPDDYITINPDDMKTELINRHLLPEYEGINPGESAALMHEESSKLAWDLHYRAVAEGKNVIWDMTMSSVSGVEQRLNKLNDAGYKVKLVYVHTTVETSIKRSDARYAHGLESDPKMARYVPHGIITAQRDPEYATKNRRAFESVKQRATDGWFLFDNNGKEPQLVSRSEA